MNKFHLGLIISSLFMLSSAYAEDTSAVLNISGTISAKQQTAAGCSVQLSNSSVNMTTDMDHLAPQGLRVTPGAIFGISIEGADCKTLAEEGRILYKFTGITDAATGKVLANTDVSEGAAKNVGIGLYEADGAVRDMNSTAHPTSSVSSYGLGLVSLTGQKAVSGSVTGALTIELERL